MIYQFEKKNRCFKHAHFTMTSCVDQKTHPPRDFPNVLTKFLHCTMIPTAGYDILHNFDTSESPLPLAVCITLDATAVQTR